LRPLGGGPVLTTSASQPLKAQVPCMLCAVTQSGKLDLRAAQRGSLCAKTPGFYREVSDIDSEHRTRVWNAQTAAVSHSRWIPQLVQ
jgi:hypothetical protein